MARNLKGFRKINIDGDIYHWKVKTGYYERTLFIYSSDFVIQKVVSDDSYGNLDFIITPIFVEYCIRNNTKEVNNDEMKEFLFNIKREKKLKRILNNEDQTTNTIQSEV